MTPQSMTEAVARLVELGYVRRRPDPDHGRVIRAELTAAGRRALERCDRAVDAVEREMLGGLAAEAAAVFRRALRDCGRALGHDLPEAATAR